MTELETKRVAVARDALAQVGTLSLGESVGYLCISRQHNICEGCAIGALFLARFGEKEVVAYYEGCPGSENIHRRLRDLWSGEQLYDIEEAYEEGRTGDNRGWSCVFPFNQRRERLIAILQNIIRNNGTFVPTDIQPIEPDAPRFPTTDFKSHALADARLVLEEV